MAFPGLAQAPAVQHRPGQNERVRYRSPKRRPNQLEGAPQVHLALMFLS